MLRRPPRPPLFPYTTLFRSRRPVVRQLVTAAGQLDRIARERAQAERGTVDQPELALLPLVHRTRALLHQDRKSTRLNSSHSQISYAVFCLKKKLISTQTSPL